MSITFDIDINAIFTKTKDERRGGETRGGRVEHARTGRRHFGGELQTAPASHRPQGQRRPIEKGSSFFSVQVDPRLATDSIFVLFLQ